MNTFHLETTLFLDKEFVTEECSTSTESLVYIIFVQVEENVGFNVKNVSVKDIKCRNVAGFMGQIIVLNNLGQWIQSCP